MKSLFLTLAILLCCCSNVSASEHLASKGVKKVSVAALHIAKSAGHSLYAVGKFLI